MNYWLHPLSTLRYFWLNYPATFLFLSYIVGFIVWICIYKILKKRQGTVRIRLPQGVRYAAGDFIKGDVELKLNKDRSFDNIFGYLEAFSWVATPRDNGGSTKRRHLHFRREFIIPGEVSRAQIRVRVFPFELQVPKRIVKTYTRAVLKTLADAKKANQELGTGLLRHQLEQEDKDLKLMWEVFVYVDLAGINLDAKHPVDIDLLATPSSEVVTDPESWTEEAHGFGKSKSKYG